MNHQATILIVDDEPVNIKVLSKLLKQAGYHTVVATSGEEALAKAKEILPDLIMLDVMMPGLDGFDTCHHLKADPRTQEIPVIFLSVLDESIEKVRAFQTGGADYITKPFHITEVLARVKHHLALHKALFEIRQLNAQLEQRVQERTAQLTAANLEMQRMLEREKETSELQLSFFAMTSHEFRTPLSIILLAADILENSDPQWLDPKKLRNIRRIKDNVKHIRQSLTDILTIARFEARNFKFNPTYLNLQNFCMQVLEGHQTNDPSAPKVKFIYSGDNEDVNIDGNLLYTILTNLLSNAIKYSTSGDMVNCNVSLKEESVIISVEDRGIGIPLVDQAYVFDTFYRGENVGKIRGSGLGLAIVKKCVELHQGEINLESTDCKGTMFMVKLPTNSMAVPSSQT